MALARSPPPLLLGRDKAVKLTLETMPQDEAREIAKKPAVAATLRDIASGDMIVSQDGRNGYLEEFQGVKFRDPDFKDRKLIVPGVMTLIWAGYLTDLCTVTEAGSAALSQNGDRK